MKKPVEFYKTHHHSYYTIALTDHSVQGLRSQIMKEEMRITTSLASSSRGKENAWIRTLELNMIDKLLVDEDKRHAMIVAKLKDRKRKASKLRYIAVQQVKTENAMKRVQIADRIRPIRKVMNETIAAICEELIAKQHDGRLDIKLEDME